MTSSTWLPTGWPTRPWSQPWMTWPVPMVVVNGEPFSHEESNGVPSQSQPLYWNVTFWPDSTAGPVPVMSGWTTSSVGGSPATGSMLGAPFSARVTDGQPGRGLDGRALGAGRDGAGLGDLEGHDRRPALLAGEGEQQPHAHGLARQRLVERREHLRVAEGELGGLGAVRRGDRARRPRR